jgi:hypothetical protein
VKYLSTELHELFERGGVVLYQGSDGFSQVEEMQTGFVWRPLAADSHTARVGPTGTHQRDAPSVRQGRGELGRLGSDRGDGHLARRAQ